MNKKKMVLEQFEELVSTRFACRSFEKRPVQEKLIEKLLDITRRAPSSFNLQPTHYIVVRKEEMKKALWEACLKQNQILEADFLLVFASDRRVVEHNAESVIQEELKSGSLSEEKSKMYRSFMKLGFDTSCFRKLIKKLTIPFIRWRAVLPTLPLENLDAWLAKQASLSCMTFMWAAEAAGLSTCPMDAFDEKRLKKMLFLDSSWYIPIIVAVGYGVAPSVKTSRLPLSESVTWM